MARGGQELLESQLPWPWTVRRNHGFPVGWANRWGKKDGNAQQTAQGQLMQSKDVNVLALVSSSFLLGKHKDANRKEAGGVSGASSF